MCPRTVSRRLVNEEACCATLTINHLTLARIIILYKNNNNRIVNSISSKKWIWVSENLTPVTLSKCKMCVITRASNKCCRIFKVLPLLFHEEMGMWTSKTERMYDACKRGDAALCRDMLRTQPDLVNAPLTDVGHTAAHVASFYQQVDISKMLIAEYGADVNATDDNLSTCLHYAMGYNEMNYAVFLVEHGADISAKDRQGKMPLDPVFGKLDTIIAVKEAYAERTRDCLLALVSIYPQLPLDLHELIMSHVLQLFINDTRRACVMNSCVVIVRL